MLAPAIQSAPLATPSLQGPDEALRVAIIIPCHNEAQTIADVVSGFREALPDARVYVFDNNSTDGTAREAARAGARVFREKRQGKGHVVRRMFADIEADIYLMADGDGTYSPEDAEALVNTLLTERVDMVVGTRRHVTVDAGRKGHAFGNKIFNRLYRSIFGKDFTDIFSGYRVFSRRFVKSFPAVSDGFEIETEMSVHASRLKMPVCELELDYGRRPAGSHSKLSTFGDGRKILWMFAMLMKETRPFAFYLAIASALLAASLTFMTPVILEYIQTGLVPRMPTWILSMMLLISAVMIFTVGLILDSLARSRAEILRIHYMDMPALSAMTRPAFLPAPGTPQKRATRSPEAKAA